MFMAVIIKSLPEIMLGRLSGLISAVQVAQLMV